jgi:DNA-binding response OmpR family regulator
VSPHPATILLATTNTDAVERLEELLHADGHDTMVRTTADSAIESLRAHAADLAIVSLALPDSLTAFAVIRTVRSSAPFDPRIDTGIPLLVVDPTPNVFNCLRAFEHGCDDYVHADCSPLELRARIQALLRRTSAGMCPEHLTIGSLEINSQAHQARVNGVELKLSRKEFALLRELASRPDHVFSNAELLRTVWDCRALIQTRTVESHASRLRRKLAAAGAPDLIRNVWGVGYRLNENSHTEAA